ncbi:MAG TPA: cytochrome d ubiquinol oxidase subunit II [Syntrophorhabdaceae bacterium]|jgi:cytochrome d ubiquinol oxidase subunit II
MVLIHLWAGIIGLAMILYIILDGISLGMALLFPLAADPKKRAIMTESIAPVWDTNQTWLVFGAAAIFAAFPSVYAILSSALYIPLMAFVMGLIFRGVTFEFRTNAKKKGAWDRAFFFGSLVAVLSQGFMLGGILSGISISQDVFSGGAMDWLNTFSLLVGFSLIPGYVMLASCYLILKTEGEVQELGYRYALPSTLLVLFFMAVVTVWTPYHYPLVWQHWFSAPRIHFVWSFPLLGLISAYLLLKALHERREPAPLLCAFGLFLSGYLGLITSLYPYAIPPTLTFTEAAAQPETLRFTLWGAAIVLPVVIGYVVYSYAVFRGKVGAGRSYE